MSVWKTYLPPWKMKRWLIGFLFLNRSCLLHRFVKNEWRMLSSQTIGVEFATKIIKVGSGARRKRIKLQVFQPAPRLAFARSRSKVLTYDVPDIVMGYSRNRAFSIRFEVVLSRSGGRNSSIRHRIASIVSRATAVSQRCESAGVASSERHAGGKQAGFGF